MIKVLEEKEVPRAKHTCTNCHSVLEYGNADLYEDFSKPQNYNISAVLNDRASKSYYLICPVCNCKDPVNWIV